MTTIQIDRFHSRATLPYAARATGRARLATATEQLVQALSGLLDAYGLSPTIRVCIRSLTVRLRLSAQDFGDRYALAGAWAAAIADAIGDAYADPGGVATATLTGADEVVVYRSEAAALTDLIVSAGRGDRRRRWAWQQLGLCSAGPALDPAGLFVEALGARPELALPVLTWAAASGQLERIGLDWAVWPRLVAAVGPFAAASGRAVRLPDPEAQGSVLPAAQVAAALSASPLGRVLARTVERLGPPPALLREPLARLVLAADAPELPRTPSLIAAAAARLFPTDELRSPDPGPASPSSDPRLPARAGKRPPDLAAEGPFPGTKRETAVPDPVSRVVSQHEPGNDQGPPDDPPASEAWTAYAGLVFLLNLATVDPRHLDVPDRPLRWTLIALGRRLSGAAYEDPAVLAFAGLSPHVPAPRALLEPPTPDERNTIERLTDAVTADLGQRLARLALAPTELLDHVVGRRARVVADPGWIELTFAMDSVDLELRRAGLDLDPGPVGFLGCVVRFGYE